MAADFFEVQLRRFPPSPGNAAVRPNITCNTLHGPSMAPQPRVMIERSQ
jgi:hypothetical protein